MKKCSIVFMFCLIAMITMSCNQNATKTLSIEDSTKDSSFKIMPLKGTFKAKINVLLNEDLEFSFVVSDKSKFSQTFKVDKTGSNEIYNYDWYENEMHISFEGNAKASEPISIEMEFIK